ncbi:rhomboid family intramembrane serine protease [Maridesulfovibrio bastinii]|uniref:rhomboid family intramembrane serine protease n=1 Tax=Maridesulfovibrio bastinii TaxID=47157 RepID=UPI00040E9C8F|nr:rhomboid family intramembrane serine protease [Maridesulfovibrio bastinii]
MADVDKNRFCLLWEDISTQIKVDSADRDTFKKWSLVLMSQSIPHFVDSSGSRIKIFVYTPYVNEACSQIELFIAENRAGTKTEVKNDPVPLAAPMVVLYMFYLLCMYVLSRTFSPVLGLYPEKIESIGRLDAARILSGEWWRALTAVTLHGDPAHIFGNMVIGGMLISVLAQRIGAGYALFPAVCCAALANIINAWLHGSDFLAVGFSGAVFAATGILAAFEAFSTSDMGFRQAFVAVAAGLSLLAALGTGGENTDLAGHFLGFAFGLATGLLLRICNLFYSHRGQMSDYILYLCSFILLLAAWGVAFYRVG